uniref:Uncharacterized protein n=1 Tax=Octopus bimaculoides TaxID=37653 RepID=A0A0L8I5A4_OCTBM
MTQCGLCAANTGVPNSSVHLVVNMNHRAEMVCYSEQWGETVKLPSGSLSRQDITPKFLISATDH